MIPADQYQVRSVLLQAAPGTRLFESSIPPAQKVTVSPGAPAVLKIGAPLESTVAVTRFGGILQLRYVLKGAGGEVYMGDSTRLRNPPRFTISKGGRVLAAGNFEFG
jgi:hypothetical protein